MNYYQLMYWVTRADSIRHFFDISSDIFTVISIFSFIMLLICKFITASEISEQSLRTTDEEKINPNYRSAFRGQLYSLRIFIPSLILSLLTWFGYMAIPTKKDAILILSAGSALTFLSSDSSAKALPSELTGYILSEIKQLKKEVELETITSDAKNKIIEEAKTMTATQLMEKIKSDTTFANIIIGK